MAKSVLLPSRAVLACILVLILYAGHYCCTSESGYCEADGNCPLQNVDNGDVQAVPDSQQYSVISYISGAVGSLLRPLKNVITKTIDEATKIAYKVWIVAIEELHKATKDYIPAVLTLLLFIFCLLFSYLMWRWQVRCCYIVLFMCGTYLLYVVVGPEVVFTMLWRFSQYCFHFINAIAFNRWYRFAFTFVIAVLGVVSLVLIPCIRRSTQDRLSCIEETMTLLLGKMSDIEDSQRTLEENQNQMLQLLKDLYDQERQN